MGNVSGFRDSGYTRPGVPDEMKWAPVLRGFPHDVEVLTDVGWVLFSSLVRAGVQGTRSSGGPLFTGDVDWSLEHRPLREKWEDNLTSHQRKYEFGSRSEVVFHKWGVGSDFPRVASLSSGHVVGSREQSGILEWVRPEFATHFVYDNRQLVWLKKRGLDLVVPRFTDVFVKNKFQSSWGFGVADDFCLVPPHASGGKVFKNLVYKYSPQGVLFGDVDVRRVREGVDSGEVRALLKGTDPARLVLGEGAAKRVRIWDVFPFEGFRDEVSGRFQASERLRSSVDCYNFVLPAGSSHTLIVRRAGKVVQGEKPVTEWVGFPVIVGDGYDKNRIVEDNVKGFYS